MNIRRQAWSFTVALGAAYLLVLQLLLTGMAFGAHAASMIGSDMPICRGMEGSGTPVDERGSAPRVPDCCQLACQTGSLAGGPTDTALVVLAPPSSTALYLAPASDAPRGDDGSWKPHNSRAPPRHA